jgi:hypothetical protein
MMKKQQIRICYEEKAIVQETDYDEEATITVMRKQEPAN